MKIISTSISPLSCIREAVSSSSVWIPKDCTKVCTPVYKSTLELASLYHQWILAPMPTAWKTDSKTKEDYCESSKYWFQIVFSYWKQPFDIFKTNPNAYKCFLAVFIISIAFTYCMSVFRSGSREYSAW